LVGGHDGLPSGLELMLGLVVHTLEIRAWLSASLAS
jgi:hypothetical protein